MNKRGEIKDNDLGFRTSKYDYWDDYKNWLKQLKVEKEDKWEIIDN